MDDKLKPCPFCGGKSKIVEDEIAQGYASGKYYMTCSSTKGCVMNRLYHGKKSAIKAWNRRKR